MAILIINWFNGNFSILKMLNRLRIDNWKCFKVNFKMWFATILINAQVVEFDHDFVQEEKAWSSPNWYLWQINNIAGPEISLVIVRVGKADITQTQFNYLFIRKAFPRQNFFIADHFDFGKVFKFWSLQVFAHLLNFEFSANRWKIRIYLFPEVIVQPFLVRTWHVTKILNGFNNIADKLVWLLVFFHLFFIRTLIKILVDNFCGRRWHVARIFMIWTYLVKLTRHLIFRFLTHLLRWLVFGNLLSKCWQHWGIFLMLSIHFMIFI